MKKLTKHEQDLVYARLTKELRFGLYKVKYIGEDGAVLVCSQDDFMSSVAIDTMKENDYNLRSAIIYEGKLAAWFDPNSKNRNGLILIQKIEIWR